MATTVAEVVLATLKASGVRRVYGIPGDSLNGFTLYATRTIPSGSGEELVELTKTNLRELDVE